MWTDSGAAAGGRLQRRAGHAPAPIVDFGRERDRDGTYSGTGTSRRGNVTVSVTVAGGKISNVSITSVTTQYPVSRISTLPGQVVSRQSAQVDNVSGATYSAQAFRLAVQAALAAASA